VHNIGLIKPAEKQWTRRRMKRPSSGNCKKSTAIPLQLWTDPEVSRRLRLPDFKTIGT